MVALNEHKKRPRSRGASSGSTYDLFLLDPPVAAAARPSPLKKHKRADPRSDGVSSAATTTALSRKAESGLLAYLNRAKAFLWKKKRAQEQQLTEQQRRPEPGQQRHRMNGTSLTAEQRFQAKRDWDWEVAKAKASGQPPPPKPAILLLASTRPPASQFVPIGNGNGMGKQQQQPEYRRKSAIGTDKHRQAVKQKSAAQIQELRNMESRYDAARAEGFKGSFESFIDRERYKKQVQQAQAQDVVMDAFEPSQSLLKRRQSLGSLRKASDASTSTVSKTRNETGTSSSTTTLDQLIRDAKRLGPPPPRPDPARFPKFTELQEQLSALQREARERFDEDVSKKRRRRKWPKRLSPDDQETVNEAFKDPSFVAKVPGGEVVAKDIRKLKGLTWLNDEIVTFYAIMINERSKRIYESDDSSTAVDRKQFKRAYAFNSFFYGKLSTAGFAGVKRWTKRVDLFAHDIVIVPINVSNSHWVCAAINLKQKRFEYYDSLGGANATVYKRLRDYLVAEHQDKKKKPLSLEGWTDYWDDEIPQQENSSDCGVFTCQFMDSLSRQGEGFDFDQANIPYLRDRMVLDIMNGEIREEEYYK